ncbi:MAG: hypothetical protein JXD19_12310 [Deltaproteobacteria bacterium]|nr:hypothetical protein [Deltaproteobacteria bacterium]
MIPFILYIPLWREGDARENKGRVIADHAFARGILKQLFFLLPDQAGKVREG